jgi:hypothetical protein
MASRVDASANRPRSAIADALFDALAELETMDALEDFELCR